MKNILCEGYLGKRLPKQVQVRRMQQVIHRELTPLQQETLLAYYLHNKTIPQIAKERGVHKSTVSRTLRRAEHRVRLCLKY